MALLFTLLCHGSVFMSRLVNLLWATFCACLWGWKRVAPKCLVLVHTSGLSFPTRFAFQSLLHVAQLDCR